MELLSVSFSQKTQSSLFLLILIILLTVLLLLLSKVNLQGHELFKDGVCGLAHAFDQVWVSTAFHPLSALLQHSLSLQGKVLTNQQLKT